MPEMKNHGLIIVKGTAWTALAFGTGQLVRFATNVVLARLLAPELFGIMVIVNALRTGIDLITNAGIGQSVVQSKEAGTPEFYNTAWSLAVIRGAFLWIVCLGAALPLAHLYKTPILAWILPIAGLTFVLGGLNSLSDYQISRELNFAKLNLFQLIVEFISSVGLVILAYFSPTIWALVFGLLLGSSVRLIGTYILLPTLRHTFNISRLYAQQIWTFGKWMLLSSIIYFFAMNFDRLYLGKYISLQILGVYGIGRSLSDPVVLLTQRISGIVIFPLIASSLTVTRANLRGDLASIRLKFLLAAVIGVSIFVATGDLLVNILYDQRYQAASWMVPLLVIGCWFSVLCAINESILFGLGRTSYGAAGNALKLAWLFIALPLGFTRFGTLGAVAAIAVADFFRYFPILVGQIKERFSFGTQDLLVTLLLFGLILFWESLRQMMGFGTSLENIPL
jgi:O-antigen/teichoic acid export membrane protein